MLTLLPAHYPRRYSVVMLASLAIFVCYLDRVNISVAIIPMAAQLGWDVQTQGSVLSAFFVGYLLLQVVGGRLADRFGGKVVLGAGVLLWSLFTLLTPPAAHLGLGMLIAARVLMGMGEAVTFPSMYSIYSRWVPLRERARAMGLSNSGIPAGTVFALAVTPLIVAAYGWEWAFYVFGLVGIVWFAIWQATVTATPDSHPDVKPEELATIQADVGKPVSTARPPWKGLFRSSAVWAIIVAHFCNNWSLYVLLSWLPTFVNKGLGVDYAQIGWFAMIPNLVSFLFLNIAGNIADRLIRRGHDVGRVRKLMQTIAFGGMATSLAVVGYVHTAWMAIAIMAAGSAVGGFVTGGFCVNHMDIAPRYAGTLMGITNTAATVPGIVGVYVSGMILQKTGSWVLVFQAASAVTLFGLVFFLIFARGDRQFE